VNGKLIHWPLELLEILQSSGLKREIKSENRIKNNENRENLLEMFKNIKINEELIAELGNSLMRILKESCKELNFKEITEDNKTYLKVTFNDQ
jgi:hypothetical protein